MQPDCRCTLLSVTVDSAVASAEAGGVLVVSWRPLRVNSSPQGVVDPGRSPNCRLGRQRGDRSHGGQASRSTPWQRRSSGRAREQEPAAAGLTRLRDRWVHPRWLAGSDRCNCLGHECWWQSQHRQLSHRRRHLPGSQPVHVRIRGIRSPSPHRLPIAGAVLAVGSGQLVELLDHAASNNQRRHPISRRAAPDEATMPDEATAQATAQTTAQTTRARQVMIMSHGRSERV